jgi:hypothetical protein
MTVLSSRIQRSQPHVLAYKPLVIIFKNGNGYVVPGGSDQIYQFKISRLRQTLRQTYEFTRGMCGPVKCCSVDTSSSIFALPLHKTIYRFAANLKPTAVATCAVPERQR